MRAIHVFFIICLSIIFLQPAHAEQTHFTHSTGLRPPYVPSETHPGFLSVLIKEMYGRLGLTVEIIVLPAERVLINVNKGIEDGCVLRIKGLEKKFPNLVRVPEMMMHNDFVGYHRLSEAPKGHQWQTLDPFQVSYITGWQVFDFNLKQHPHCLKVKNAEQLFTALKNDRTDVALYERWQGAFMINQMGIKNAKTIEPPFVKKEMFMYLNKKHTDLAPKLATALKEIKADGTYQKYYDMYLNSLLDN